MRIDAIGATAPEDADCVTTPEKAIDGMSLEIHGQATRVQPWRVRGWAWAGRDQPLAVEIVLDGQVVGRGRAELALGRRAADADGPVRMARCGFSVVSRAMLAEGASGLVVRAGLGGNMRELAFKPMPELPAEGAHDGHARPVFVLGAARSGTSAMGRALRHSLHVSGHGEGHMLSALPMLLEQLGLHYHRYGVNARPGAATMLAQTEPGLVRDALRRGFIDVMRSAFPDGRWLDKTPTQEMIRAAPLLHGVWPGARFVVLRRRGIENVLSRQRKFPAESFGAHCRNWAEAVEEWEMVAPVLARAGARVCTVEQLEMARRPQAVAARLAVGLELDADEARRLLLAMRTEHPQRSGTSPGAVCGLPKTGWSASEQAQFRAECGGTMKRCLYTMDGSYAPWAREWLDGRPAMA